MRKQELHPRTAVINKEQKNKSKKSRQEALVWLAVHFPNAFDNSLRIRPLKTGIMEDILQHADKAAEAGITKSKLREAVVIFTRRLDYLACLKARELRVDLDGHEVGEVTEEEAVHAGAKIKKRVEKSMRNARKSTEPSSNSQTTTSNRAATQNAAPAEDFLPIYPRRSVPFGAQPAAVPTPKAAAVVVKHKTTRQFDPNAVARLKEKLGLTRSGLQQEIVE